MATTTTTTMTRPAPATGRTAPKSRRFITGVIMAVLLAATPAFAITAGDVLDRMSADERGGYITGAIDTAIYLAAVQEKNNAKSECILNWYYGDKAKGPREVIATFERYKDKPAVALIKVLIDRACPK